MRPFRWAIERAGASAHGASTPLNRSACREGSRLDDCLALFIAQPEAANGVGVAEGRVVTPDHPSGLAVLTEGTANGPGN